MNPLTTGDNTIFKADFYKNGHVIGLSVKGGYIYSTGSTTIEDNGDVFHSVEKLLDKNKNAKNDYENWKFIEEKEWVVTRTGEEFLHSFTTIAGLPKNTKFRC